MKKQIVFLALLSLPLIAWEGTYYPQGDSEGELKITECKKQDNSQVCEVSIGSIGGMDVSGAPHFCDFMGSLIIKNNKGEVFLNDNGEGKESLEFTLVKNQDSTIHLKPVNNGENQYLYCGMNARIFEANYQKSN